jgi:hypothetical protein
MGIKRLLKNKLAMFITSQTFQIIIMVLFILVALYLGYEYVLTGIIPT